MVQLRRDRARWALAVKLGSGVLGLDRAGGKYRSIGAGHGTCREGYQHAPVGAACAMESVELPYVGTGRGLAGVQPR